MNDRILKDLHLCINDRIAYLDGAVHVFCETVKEVYPHSFLVKEESKSGKGLLVLPGFFDTGLPVLSNKEVKKEKLDELSLKLVQKGTCQYLLSLNIDENSDEVLSFLDTYQSPYNYFMGVHIEKNDEQSLNGKEMDLLLKHPCIRKLTIKGESITGKQCESLKEKGIFLFIGPCRLKEKEAKRLPLDGIAHLYQDMSSFDAKEPGIINMAFDSDLYTEICVSDCDPSVLRFTCRNIPRDRLILTGENGSLKEETEGMLKEGYDPLDIVAYAALNANRCFGFEKRFGSFVKGRYAAMVFFNDKKELVSTYCKGVFYHV